MANILLVATGGTRAPTQIELCKRFVKDGHAVRLIASANALRFLTSYLARRPREIVGYVKRYRPVLRETLAYFIEKPKQVPHIAEGKWADVVVMAPATCNSVGKLAAGLSDNYPLLVLRAIGRTKNVIVVPSMNPEMWYDPLFQRNVDLLNATEKYRVLCPRRGQMLSGDWGFGAQVPLEDIVTETYRALGILDARTEAFLEGTRAGEVPWAEEEDMAEPGAAVRIAIIDGDAEVRSALCEALSREYPQMKLEEFGSASHALEWLRENDVSGVVTEIDFDHGATGFDLIEHLRHPGHEHVEIIATSTRDRSEIGAERLARLDVLFVPKPQNLPFVVGMVAGALCHGDRRRTAMSTRVLAPHEVLFREGDSGTDVFIVRTGRLRITRRVGGKDVELGIAEPGEMVGELAFVDQTVRSATLTALERTELAVLDLESVRASLESQPAWLRIMLRSLIGHLRETSTKVKAETGRRG